MKSSPAPRPRPLIGGAALVLLVGGAALALLVFLPMSRARLQRAQSAEVSSLSLSYLELSLSQHPNDVELRKALVQKLFDSGQRDKARATLGPLVAKDAVRDLDAHKTLLALDRARWAAIPAGNSAAREAALAELLQTVRALEALQPPIAELMHLAQLYRELDQPLAAAQLLDRLARRGSADVEARVSARAALAMRAARRP